MRPWLLAAALLGVTAVLVARTPHLWPARLVAPAGRPGVLQPHRPLAAGPRRANIYAAATQERLSPAVADVPARVYVPNSGDGSVDVIDPQTFAVVAHFPVGRVPHHIAPSWDFARLYVDNTASGTLTEIDPKTGRPAGTRPVRDPYNLYFTPDGTKAIVVAERVRSLDFYRLPAWTPMGSVVLPWRGVDHLDFSADGRYLLASTEFDGMLVKVDTVAQTVAAAVRVGGLPVDVRLSPDGTVFFVTNQGRHGVSVIDADRMAEIAFIPTGRGAHGLAVSRDARALYVSNRLAGTISVIDAATRQVTASWAVGGSPDMLQVSPDGRQLWASNRFGRTVSVIDTATGQVLHRIRVGANPHGLAYFPQPGRFSVGHNGVYR